MVSPKSKVFDIIIYRCFFLILVLLPHIGYCTQKTERDMAILASNNILCGLSGERMPSQVNSIDD